MRQAVGTGLGIAGLVLLAGLSSCASVARVAIPEYAEKGLEDYGIEYELLVRSSPRPLRIHLARADMGSGKLRLATPLPLPDDEGGSWEARLVDPVIEAESIRSLLLVNASAFSVLGYEMSRPLVYKRGDHVDIAGLAAQDGRIFSPPQRGYSSIWTDAEGRTHPRREYGGFDPRAAGCVDAASGFSMLVEDSFALPQRPGRLAARTAIGEDGSGRLLFVVVEGGKKGVSEGVRLDELASVMIELGASWALNMDGGGSSVMVLLRNGKEEQVTRSEHELLGVGSSTRPVPNFVALLPR